jgi:hypothetical protein
MQNVLVDQATMGYVRHGEPETFENGRVMVLCFNTLDTIISCYAVSKGSYAYKDGADRKALRRAVQNCVHTQAVKANTDHLNG